MNFTPTQTPLNRLETVLSMLDYPCQLLSIDDGNPFEQIIVALDEQLEADQEARYVMQIFFAEDAMRASGLAIESEDPTATLQFMIELPVDCQGLSDARLLQTYEALNTLTQLMPIGNLGLNNTKKVYYRYALMGDSQNMNATLIADLIGMFGFFLNQFGPLLTEFVASDKDVETLMQETGLNKAFENAQPAS